MISLNDTSKHYGGAIAIDHITAELKENKIYCLLGRNGAGKTTLLKMIAGHINASSGQIEVCGRQVKTSVMPENVNFIENKMTQFNTTVGMLLKMAGNLNDDFDYDFAKSMANRFQLDLHKKYKQLSFGMQTMLTTLMGLASNANVVILDEPLLGFDAVMRKEFYEMLNDSFEKHPKLIIVSTHMIDEIAKSAQRVMILDKGRLIFEADINDIDEKAYVITGRTADVDSIVGNLNVISKKILGSHTSAFIYDERGKVPAGVSVQSVGLQEFFVNMVGGNADE